MNTLEERQEHFNKYVKDTTAEMKKDLLEIIRRENELEEREKEIARRERDYERQKELDEIENMEHAKKLGEDCKALFKIMAEEVLEDTLKRCREIEDLLDLIHASELTEDNVDMYRAKYIEYTGFNVVPKDVSECEFIEPEPVKAEEAILVEVVVPVEPEELDLGQFMSMVEPNPILAKVVVKVVKGRKKLTKTDHENIIKNLQKDIDNLKDKPYSEHIKKELASLRRKVSYRKAQIKKLEKGNAK